MIVLDTFIVDTDAGCGGSLRVIIWDEETDETRTIFLDLADLHSNGESGYIVCPDRPHIMDGLNPTGNVVNALAP
mgnify:FL=1